MVTHEYGDPRLWTTSGTRMLLNEEIPVLDEYKDKFEQVDVTMIDKRVEMGSQLKKAIPMTLRQLLDEYDTLKHAASFAHDQLSVTKIPTGVKNEELLMGPCRGYV
ncbi:hypothetical protein ACFE04_024100 [Oxalis oulophora]